MASTAPKELRDRSNYLPLEAQSLRRCIAELYEESIGLYKKAAQESRRKSQETFGGRNIWDMIGIYPDDICGLASYAKLRVPVRYPSNAVPLLKRSALFELPGVLDWLLEEGREMPKMRQYLETVDYLRLQILDYIQRFDELTIDMKSF